jgi:hypothetical protein
MKDDDDDDDDAKRGRRRAGRAARNALACGRACVWVLVGLAAAAVLLACAVALSFAPAVSEALSEGAARGRRASDHLDDIHAFGRRAYDEVLDAASARHYSDERGVAHPAPETEAEALEGRADPRLRAARRRVAELARSFRDEADEIMALVRAGRAAADSPLTREALEHVGPALETAREVAGALRLVARDGLGTLHVSADISGSREPPK